ncbi:hypoxanthine phosphoribosyltransferase [Citroniella saccharovorans]|uniref:Hypoxanthine phosphoribosyltransferase n=1 Tax=Citroniella saccharovorans TaxID=2053367 RepID=A0AAW9MYN1_9FIRM|nr:hypoxanthine phosphoribosyltransferase [Citroniella saccharovorans]MEB3429584.1 hypoxanthine phosphoribosyltransferase [Citroniella saccharovorans]
MKSKVLFSEEVIKKRISEIAKSIKKDLGYDDLVVIALLRGGFIYASDLVRKLRENIIIDFITTSSYDNNEYSSGVVDILSDIRTNVENKNVLIVDDILDSGRTLLKVKKHIESKNPKNIKTSVLLDKKSRRIENIEADYVGFEIEDYFVVGYGLNYGEYFRNVPYIFIFE